ncbi:hypothetical protein BV22DRAFT_1007589 [Leucogyrophana mollusca]|uniref:Uncharacterized protein n=1 Tax=Leucogyrophana mollusca TaxID=85980 RepID=A0ACB8BPH5_9AGAM|nr:hypothetical protein BV22DRAFT_1007589 [Leucogyrophana mollusca]
MSTELKTIRKKRTASEATASTPAPEGDHRKRRRNRTTQSCLNCHTSKRMCDRKRPCGRCTQLGLTGLCVYEVDDPSQRSDVQDEGSRLRKRVAELEGVIRELKNKPHPRWVQSGSSPGEEFEKWHARAQSRPASDDSQSEPPNLSVAPSPRSAEVSSESNDDRPGSNHSSHQHQTSLSSLSNGYPSPSYSHPVVENAATSSTSSYSPYFGVSSPLSTPSPATMTPTDEYSRTQVLIAGENQLPRDFDLASIFMSYPGLMGCDDGLGYVDRALRHDSITEHLDDTCLSKHQSSRSIDGHCGCLNEGASYNVVLELSLRLRKAADILGRSANHRLGSGCMLNQRISELDALATTTLGNITTSPNDLNHLARPRPPVNNVTSNSILPNTTFASGPCNPNTAAATVSPQSLQGIRSWDIMSSVSDSSSTCDDSFMSWEPSRRG